MFLLKNIGLFNINSSSTTSFSLYFIQLWKTSIQKRFFIFINSFLMYSVLHPTNLSDLIKKLMKSCHLLSDWRSFLIHVNFNASINAARFTIFKPPSQYRLITTFLLIFTLLIHKKLKNMLLIWLTISWSGLSKVINKWLKAGMNSTFIADIFPNGVRFLFPTFLLYFLVLLFWVYSSVPYFLLSLYWN